ncbi:hypothetical protein QBC44DRAFT_91502 [Cladorrhinum sp. PSN332]|nr:hypothetical protein QBC44DRAFT_91502 [Cladorrhinum sp. PSN332]
MNRTNVIACMLFSRKALCYMLMAFGLGAYSKCAKGAPKEMIIMNPSIGFVLGCFVVAVVYNTQLITEQGRLF